MITAGEIISYGEMCRLEEVNTLQRGMNFRIKKNYSIVLMSRRNNAPYLDKIEKNGQLLIYEGHNISKKDTHENPKTVDQPLRTPNGSLTQNGKFFEAALKSKENSDSVELVKVYEKIYSGVWVYNGLFKLVDALIETTNKRKVFKFNLELTDQTLSTESGDLKHNRVIPAKVKQEVWKRDQGRCVQCGKDNNLHFDHIIPYSKGGSSLVADNIQILCARHNLSKHDSIV